MVNRRLGARAQWAIAIAVTGLGVLATLAVANAINHAGWSPWSVALTWILVTAVATLLIKLRRSSLRGQCPGAPEAVPGPGLGIPPGGVGGG